MRKEVAQLVRMVLPSPAASPRLLTIWRNPESESRRLRPNHNQGRLASGLAHCIDADNGHYRGRLPFSDYVGDALIRVHVIDPQVRKLTSTYAGVHEEPHDRRVPPTYKIIARCRGEEPLKLVRVKDGHRRFRDRRWLHVGYGMRRDYTLLKKE